MTAVLPFRQFVLKVHSRCDLACDHCYVYEHADQSWRGRPKAISEQTAELTARRIAEHAAEHRLPAVHVVLHGGEPLLLGLDRTRSVLQVLRTQIAPVTSLDLRIHTNGVLLDDEFCALFREFDVKVGISLDGDRAANDRHRRFANGRTSHPQVLRALELLRRPEFAQLYAGILCTIDIANDPIAVYEALVREHPPRVDFLLPHATWDSPPARIDASRAEYADWLLTIYDRWMADGRPFAVRTFGAIRAALRGEPGGAESLGLSPADLVVIETDGTLEQADSLKSAFDGAPATGLDVVRHSFDDAARHEGIEARQQGLDGLCGTCRECPVVNVCGGGLFAHRYRTGTGFANPSVYCDDLKATILHIKADSRSYEAAGSAMKLSSDEFDALASGYGRAQTIVRLAEDQGFILKRSLAELIAATRSQADTAAAGRTLARLDADAPEAITAVLRHPDTRRRVTECIAALDSGEVAPAGARYLSNLALAATALAGARARLAVAVTDHTVHLPTLGRAEIGGSGDAVVTVEGSRISIAREGSALQFRLDDPVPDPAWHPVPRLRALGVSAYAEADRPGVKLLEDTFADAVELIALHLPDYLPGMRAALTAITAPAAGSGGTIGTVAVEPADDPAVLAVRLLRGFQRAKLHAILDLFGLIESAAAAQSGSVEDLLYEAYESLAVAEFRPAGNEALDAATHAIGQLSDRPGLTDLGRRFVAGMARTAACWPDRPAGRPGEYDC
jgi:uncharacterized protein